MEVTPKGVAVVRMDVQGEKQNTFNDEFYQDMSAMVEKVESDDSIKAVVLSSSKPGSWIAGANIKQIEEIKSDFLVKDLNLLEWEKSFLINIV